MPQTYFVGDSIHIHKRILDGFLKQVGRKIDITSARVLEESRGMYVMEYTTRHGGKGTLQLNNIGSPH